MERITSKIAEQADTTLEELKEMFKLNISISALSSTPTVWTEWGQLDDLIANLQRIE
jgi:hypothetical protein